MILCASTFAGCLGGGDLTEVIDTTGAVPDPMTIDEFATYIEDMDDDDITPFGNISKAGTQIVICCTIDLGDGFSEPMENTTMTMTSMYDQELQRMMSSTILTMTGVDEAGVVQSQTVEMTRVEGAAPNGSSHEGIVNYITSESDDSGNMTGNLIKYFAFDWAWDWDVVSADLLDDNSDDNSDECHDSCSECDDSGPGDCTVCPVGATLVDEDGDGAGTCTFGDGGGDDLSGADDGILPDFGFEDGEIPFENATWALDEVVDFTTGETKFTTNIDNVTVTISVIATTPPTITSMVMDDGVMSMSTYFMFGDDVVIDLVESEGDGWMRGATDMMIGYDEPCYFSDCSSGEHIDGWMAISEDDQWLEAPNENLYLHIMGPEPDSPPPTAAEAMGNDTDGSGTISWSEFVYAWNLEEEENMSYEEATEFSMLFNESDMHYWNGGGNDAGDGELNLSELQIFIDKMEMLFGPPTWHCSSTVGGTPDTTISFELVNDGTEDCGDGSDEPQDFDDDGTTDNWFTCMDESEDDSPPPTAAEAMGNDTDGSGTISFSEFRTSWEAMEGVNMTWDELTSFSAIFNESDMHYWNGGGNDAGDGELNLSELEIFIEKMEMMDQTNISMDDVNDGWDDCENGSDEFDDDWDDGGDEDLIMIGNISISALFDTAMGTAVGCTANAFTDVDGAVWGMCWSDTNNNGLVDHPDWFNMSTNDATNGAFEILLYDADAGDYAGSMMPGFSGLLACITMLGACLFIRRKE